MQLVACGVKETNEMKNSRRKIRSCYSTKDRCKRKAAGSENDSKRKTR